MSRLRNQLLLVLLLVSCTLLLHAPCPTAAANDTLTAGQALAVHDRLVSKNGMFALGFYQPAAIITNDTTNSSSGWYLGIWFQKIPVFTIVWIANRNDPILAINHDTTKLKISPNDGNLVIMNERNELVVWSTNITFNGSISNNTTLVLENSGNLVLKSSSSSVNEVLLWQSFDHATDVALPGMKFDRNKVTGGINSPAISRKSLIDPGFGSYSIELDVSGFILKHRSSSVIYWSYPSGPVGPFLKTILQRSSTTTGLINPTYVNNEQEEHYMYTSPNESLSSTTPTFMSLDISGLITLNIWSPQEKSWKNYTQPADVCTPYATCGAFTVCNGNERPACGCMENFSVRSRRDWEVDDRTGGCIRDTPLDCRAGSDGKNTTTDVFRAISRVTLPPHNMQSIDMATSESSCQEACLGSCSCTAYAYNNNKCFVSNGELLGVNKNDAIDNISEDVLYLRLAAQDLPSLTGSKKKTAASIGSVAAVGITGFGLLMLMLFLLIWRREKLRWCCDSSSYKNQGNGGVIAFRYSDLVRATKNFSDKLGAGGFGSVFKEVLSSSSDSSSTATYIAVKRLDGVRQGEKQFRAEVSSIGLIQHINLVKLIGFCCEGDHRLLVYEHMINGSLEGLLFKSNVVVLKWNIRYDIALGVARGLSYLHQSCRECIIHCDIKPENVLLDASFAPKVADFGMAAFVGRDFSRILTTFRATAGYLAPEWLSGVAVTPKIDVYGFGMVLLEIISGRRNSPEAQVSSNYNVEFFPVKAIRELQGGDVQSLVDPELHGDFNLEQVERVCKVACWCIQNHEVNRPTMVEVVRLLEGLQEIDMPPMPRLLAAMTQQSGATSM